MHLILVGQSAAGGRRSGRIAATLSRERERGGCRGGVDG